MWRSVDVATPNRLDQSSWRLGRRPRPRPCRLLVHGAKVIPTVFRFVPFSLNPEHSANISQISPAVNRPRKRDNDVTISAGSPASQRKDDFRRRLCRCRHLGRISIAPRAYCVIKSLIIFISRASSKDIFYSGAGLKVIIRGATPFPCDNSCRFLE